MALKLTSLIINEIYLSLQGESTFAGLPCIFVRLTACNLRCSYCDTAYAFTDGKKMDLAAIREQVHALAKPVALISGIKIRSRGAVSAKNEWGSRPNSPRAVRKLQPSKH